ncbi:MAG TPA: M23 family metallopeptidase [Dermatophilaceae bacterium]|nr:M23 family metallopeptidase [Dermatophilaceae bacterium]
MGHLLLGLVLLVLPGPGVPPDMASPPVAIPPWSPPRLVVTSPAATGGFDWPFQPRPALVRAFDLPAQPWLPGHRGVDLAAREGQPVLAAGTGRVSFSGVVAGRGVVTVTHSPTLRTTYEPVEGRVPVGVPVARGDPLGTVSSAAGHCAPATCLHWGAVSNGGYIDPLGLLRLLHPVLLPLR